MMVIAIDHSGSPAIEGCNPLLRGQRVIPVVARARLGSRHRPDHDQLAEGPEKPPNHPITRRAATCRAMPRDAAFSQVTAFSVPWRARGCRAVPEHLHPQ